MSATECATHIRVLQFDHMQMDVSNLEESILFYQSVFGFQIKEVGIRLSNRWAIVGNASRLYLCMHEYSEGKDKANEGLEITHFGLIVDRFDTVRNRLIQQNVKVYYDDYVYYHSSRSVYFVDPNGYKIEISERPGGGIDTSLTQ